MGTTWPLLVYIGKTIDRGESEYVVDAECPGEICDEVRLLPGARPRRQETYLRMRNFAAQMSVRVIDAGVLFSGHSSPRLNGVPAPRHCGIRRLVGAVV
jgi:hypothetical protein